MRFLALLAVCLFALIASTMVAGEDDFCPCPRNYEPVCGSNQVTYSNACELGCAAKKEERQGRSLNQVKVGKCA